MKHTRMPQHPDHFVQKTGNNRTYTICPLWRVYTDHCTSMRWPINSVIWRLKFQKELTVELEMCWNNVRRPAKKKEIPCTKASTEEVRRYYKQLAEAKHLEYKSWVDNEFFDLVHLRKIKPRNYVTRRWVLTIKTGKQCNFLKAKARWVLRGFQDGRNINRQILLLSQDPDFGWVAKWQPIRVGTFFTLIFKQLSFKDSFWVIVMLCVNCHQKQNILLILMRDWRNLMMAGMMPLDADTKHCTVMAWFPRELIDVVFCCTHPKHGSEIGRTRALHRDMVQMTYHMYRVHDKKEMQHLSYVGSYWRMPSYRQIRGRNQLPFL